MPILLTTKAGGNLFDMIVTEAVNKNYSCLPTRAELIKFKRVFEDEEIVTTCFSLFENDLNVSRTAEKLYMHRNTLIYRLAKLRRITGLNVTYFNDAVNFIVYYRCYTNGWGVNNK